jgi:hypothetical protein
MRNNLHYVNRAAFLFLLVLVAYMAVGCSEESTGPNDNPPSLSGKHLWSMSFGDGSDQGALAVAVDASGNVIGTGFFNGTVDFGGGVLTSAGGMDVFVAKFGPSGSHLWSKSFGDGAGQTASAVTVDASGNVIIAGSFEGTLDFGGGAFTSAGDKDIFVVKFGPDGSYLWSECFGDENEQAAEAVAVDASGNVILTGYFHGTVDFGGGEIASAGNGDIFVAEFGSNGVHLWSKSFGDGAVQTASSVAVDASGNVIVTGYFYGTIDFGGGELTSAGWGDIFVAKFGSDGAHLWSNRFGDGSEQAAEAVAVDGSGNVIVTGEFGGNVDFGGGALTSDGLQNLFIAKFGPDGDHLWSKRFGHGNSQIARSVAVDASGNVIVTGYFRNTVDFGGGVLTSAGDADIFVAKFKSNATHLWSKRFGGELYQYARSVAVDASEDVIVAGLFESTVSFGGDSLTSEGVGEDIFIAKFSK